MTGYDFSSLDDQDFEVLVADLLSREHGVRYERFKRGGDGGVDGRYFSPNGSQTVFQCKHWAKSGLARLLYSLKSTEKAKVVRLDPQRYMLATSVQLSPNDKTKIKAIFGDYIVSAADIFGSEDINDLLRKYPEVEKSHFKLWLHSAQMLDTIFNAAILGRSSFTLSEILERNPRYVQTVNHSIASEKLSKNNVLLITGEPGIGKTTLAEQLCLELVTKGYQLCVAAKHVEELEGLYRTEAKQLFYFDDFLGSNFLEVLQRNEDSHIVGFINRIKKDKNKRLILTSRTTVLTRANSLTEKFKHENMSRHEFELEVKSLSDLDKAKILHNCLWFSDLPRDLLSIIIGERRYLKIINHKNFNPRLIVFITDPARLEEVSSERYWTYIEEKLQNPRDVWEHLYNNQLNDWSRALLLLVVFAGSEIDERQLRAGYVSFSSDAITNGYHGNADFDASVELLVGSVLNRRLTADGAKYSLFNPSIADYILQRTKRSPQLISSLFAAIESIHSLKNLRDLIRNQIFSLDEAQEVVEMLCHKKLVTLPKQNEIAYRSHLASTVIEFGNVGSQNINLIVSFVDHVSRLQSAASHVGRLASVINHLFSIKLLDGEVISRFLMNISAEEFEEGELDQLSKIAKHLAGDERERLVQYLRAAIIEFWQDGIQQEIVGRGILGDIYDLDDASEAELLVKREIEEILESYEIEFSESENWAIFKYCDVPDIINENVERSMNDLQDDERIGHAQSYGSEVHDLFSSDFPPLRGA
jgi:GTPase SAR1 family protein